MQEPKKYTAHSHTKRNLFESLTFNALAMWFMFRDFFGSFARFTFWICLELRTFCVHAINFRLQHGWTDHYQYWKWNETTATYDNNLAVHLQLRARQPRSRKKTAIPAAAVTTTISPHFETRRSKWNNIEFVDSTRQQKHSFRDIETSLSFEIVGWKTTTAGYFANIMQKKRRAQEHVSIHTLDI